MTTTTVRAAVTTNSGNSKRTSGARPMCEGFHDPWCSMFDEHRVADAHDFCERHQIAWCRLCDGGCPECWSWRALGEPDDEDEYDGIES
jgi:hypothetical protein